MKCKYEHYGDCCNSGAKQYLCECKIPCDTIIPMSVGDQVRAMSDEELVDLIFKYEIDMKISFCKNLPECAEKMEAGTLDNTDCQKCLLELIQKPAKEEI